MADTDIRYTPDTTQYENLKWLYPASSFAVDRRGDYLGFTYNGKHSTDFGIVRVSVSDRYSDELTPTFDTVTAKTIGRDGTYYFGSNYTLRLFTIEFAFDDVTDVQVRQMRLWFGDKKIHDLVFDENPYKVYSAKVSAVPTLKTLSFDEYAEGAHTGLRIYKGEGTVLLICYYPFARSAAEWLEDYSDEIYENKSEWAITSGIINKSGTDYNEFETGIYDTTWSGELLSEISIENDSIIPSPEATNPYIVIDDIDFTDVGAITYLDAEAWVRGATSGVSAEGVDSYIAAHDNFIDTSSGENGIYAHTYNPGDFDTDWMLIAPITDFTAAGALGLDSSIGLIGIEAITRQGTDTHLRYNSISGLLEGLEIVDDTAEIPEYRLTNHVYNLYISLLSNFKIPIGTNRINVIGFNVADPTKWDLLYKYLYL